MNMNELHRAVKMLYEASHIVHRIEAPQEICNRVWSAAWDLEHWLKARELEQWFKERIKDDVHGEGVDSNAEEEKEN